MFIELKDELTLHFQIHCYYLQNLLLQHGTNTNIMKQSHQLMTSEIIS